jgi:LuxR family transcriptional regulator, maltose regulon positive regulatory protein
MLLRTASSERRRNTDREERQLFVELKKSDSQSRRFVSVGDTGTAVWSGLPVLPTSYVRRQRLIDLLDGSRPRPLVLVSAPAGSGKTSLVTDWVSAQGTVGRTEWITFESGDEAFWPAVVTCLERSGVAVAPRSRPARPVTPDRRFLTALAAAVAGQAESLTLVLDGYDMVSPVVARDVDFLLRHSGHRLQLVMVTRVDPVLPVYRYRLEDSVAEVRMSDLAFTDAEAGKLLERAGVHLTAESIHALNLRTQGWVAGLRFASRFLAERDDPDGAVADVGGDRGNIAEYLMGEVLAAQTPEVRDLLLSTSIPETLQPGLAEALGGRSATRTLAILTRANAFVEPVTGHPGFYRYHPFLRDLLRAELAYEDPDQMERLQRRAADWFAREGLLEAAVNHYVAIDAWAEAADQVVDELAVGELLLDTGDSALARMLVQIPDELDIPAAAVVRATFALARGDMPRFNDELALVPDVADEEASGHERSLALAMAVLRAVHARCSPDAHQAIELAEVAEQALRGRDNRAKAETHPELSALVYASKGIATIRRGQLDRSRDLFTAGSGAAMGLGSEALLVECLGYLALIGCLQGRLTEARSLATRAVEIATQNGIRPADQPPSAHVALAWVDTEQYQLRSAAQHARLAARSDFVSGDPVSRTILAVVESRLQVAAGDATRAIATIAQARAAIPDSTNWLHDRLRLEEAHVRVVSGEASTAMTGLKEVAERQPAEVALVIARTRMAEGDEGAAAEALSHVLIRGAPAPAQVEGWLVEASRQLKCGSPAKAMAALRRSIRLAVGEGLRRPFHEVVPAVLPLLVADGQLAADAEWLDLPPALVGVPEQMQRTVTDRSPVARPTETMVVESLTVKELEVLGHLAEMLTTEEMASTMYVSVNTIRTHVRSILRKLGVSRRNAAVRRARELDLLPVSS